MFIELIDSLRCTNDHADSWLVASIVRRDDRFVTEGELGCPICLREYPIEHGVVWFGPREQHGPSTIAADDPTMMDMSGPEGAVRIGAFLNVAEGAAVLLGGTWARSAHALSELIPLRIFVLNSSDPIDESMTVGVVMSSEGIPLAPGMLRGVALDTATATPAALTSATKVLAPGGRLVAPADVAIPDDVAVLARDENFWVAEKRPPLISLVRR
ncbi:MAG: hypothetical protein ACR2MQ_13910 [Gemmatimonadaceae bacterium]